MIFALIVFILTYVLMIALPKYRLITVTVSALIFLVFGVLPIKEVFNAIDWNVLMILLGTMGVVFFFIESKMPNKMADMLILKSRNTMWAVVLISSFAGVISAFVDNVATVLMVAPVGLAIAKKIKISPVPMLICISVSANLQGAATLVGDTTSIMLGGAANMSFIDFFFMNGKPGIFWAVELGALATVPIIMFIFRKNKEKVDAVEVTEVTDYFPSILLLLNIIFLIIASFIEKKPDITNGLICVSLFIVGLVRELIKRKNFGFVKETVKSIDFETLGLLACLFIIIAGIKEAGVIDEISNLFVKVGGNNLFLTYTLIVWGSVIISAFVDNIPYVATMLPVVFGISQILGCDPLVLYFGLLTGATLGGNLTPIGASANITTIGILKKEGYEVKTSDFVKIGVPFTFVAVLVGYLFIWFVWA
ncbi:MAG: SLC13 family permease [Bacilli bacterium]|nr:TRAP transporter large permease subunit [Acholeplasmataceae bacterium]MDY2902724.1 SLC13 family permease [Bacilli bacterium]